LLIPEENRLCRNWDVKVYCVSRPICHNSSDQVKGFFLWHIGMEIAGKRCFSRRASTNISLRTRQ
jgi:hypothetical protein